MILIPNFRDDNSTLKILTQFDLKTMENPLAPDDSHVGTQHSRS